RYHTPAGVANEELSICQHLSDQPDVMGYEDVLKLAEFQPVDSEEEGGCSGSERRGQEEAPRQAPQQCRQEEYGKGIEETQQRIAERRQGWIEHRHRQERNSQHNDASE